MFQCQLSGEIAAGTVEAFARPAVTWILEHLGYRTPAEHVATFLLSSARQRDPMTLTYPNPPVHPVRSNTRTSFRWLSAALIETFSTGRRVSSDAALNRLLWRIRLQLFERRNALGQHADFDSLRKMLRPNRRSLLMLLDEFRQPRP